MPECPILFRALDVDSAAVSSRRPATDGLIDSPEWEGETVEADADVDDWVEEAEEGEG